MQSCGNDVVFHWKFFYLMFYEANVTFLNQFYKKQFQMPISEDCRSIVPQNFQDYIT